MEYQLLLAFIIGVGLLLTLILVFKLNAFISLLIGSIVVGLVSGMDPSMVVQNVIKGMGDTLGFVATVVGLGSVIGAVLESTGSTEGIARYMLKMFGESRSRAALSVSGFLIAIPVFFDVAFIILVPLVYALQKKSGKPILYYAIPLLASMAITHAFIPPTPGPIAVADILGADLGWIILYGFIVGIPVAIISGIWFGGIVAKKITTNSLDEFQHKVEDRIVDNEPPAFLIIAIILCPIILILMNTVSKSLYGEADSGILVWLQFAGHPIIALIISTLIALYFLGVKYGATKEQLQKIATRSLGPAGIIILITGAGGVFKQMLVSSGAGEMLAQQIAYWQVSPVILAFILAQIIRLMQGSATVAMITAAGIMAPILASSGLEPQQLALLVLAIAAGATGFAHVNDSGFWLVSKYLGMSEVDTLKSWTTTTGLIAILSIIIISIIYSFI